MGVESSLWEGYLDAATLTVTYSIGLARFSDPLEMTNSSTRILANSNITFGVANDKEYTSTQALTITSLSNYTYQMSNFAFGEVEYEDGVAETEYFESFEDLYPVQFTLNFQGLGLPDENFDDYKDWLKEIIDDDEIECNDDGNAICVLTEECEDYDDELLEF